MKPLIVLLAIFTISLFTVKLIQGKYSVVLSARIAISGMLLFTALGHFLFTDGMSMMISEFIPLKKELIYFTAILEIGSAIGLHLPQIRSITAWLLIIFFIAILPANIKASFEHLNYQTTTYDGKGLAYLWIRVPLQILFITWVFFSSIRITKIKKS